MDEVKVTRRYGRLVVGLAAIVGVASVVGLESPIEAKPPADGSSVLNDLGRSVPVTGRAAPNFDITAAAPERAAVPTPAQSRSPAVPSTPNRFELTGAHKLSIKVHGYAELSGEYRVNPDESVSIPAIGRVSITGMSAAELERVLIDKAARVTGRDSYITVEVAEYRPVFVSGLVARPGSHAWEPGMTALHAVTLLGGLYRATTENAGGVVIGADAEILKLRRSINDLKRSAAQLARLRAERNNQSVIDVPEELVALVGRTESQSLIAEQTSVLANRRSSLANQIAALERAKAIGTQEMGGLTAQGQRLRDALDQRRTYKEKLEGLQAKGIVRAERALDEQAKLVDLEDRATTVSVGVARVQGMLAGIERELITLRQERMADIDQEIFKLNKENAQHELEIESARSTYFKITGTQAPMSFGDKETQRSTVIEYQIVRYEGGVQTTAKVDQFARLKPGDILIVDMQKE